MERVVLVKALCVALLLLLGLVGCSGDDDSSADRLRVLVTNDDGVGAEGIDAVVEALLANPANDVTVCAPSSNRSGSSDQMGPSEFCGDLSVTAATTISGVDATAVNGCPADSVIYALDELFPADARPHVVISGINEGQNASVVIAGLSGTVGAAKTAARNGIPALAASQGLPVSGGAFDYAAGADAVLVWLAENRATLLAGFVPTGIESMNIPSCSSGEIRGTIDGLALSDDTAAALGTQDCESTLEDPADDVEAFLNGFISLATVGLE